MCGIVGYAGFRQAAPILLDGLSKLEYRGYDSAGLCVRDGDSDPVVVKAKGRLHLLAEKTDNGMALKGSTGIGHTRWATHGEPSENNAHPHVADGGEVVAVHNGIIENYQELKEKLIHNGYTFYSATDTEVVVNLIDYYNRKYRVSPIDAIAKTMVRVRGSYALVVMFKDHPGEVFAARKDSPLIMGIGEGENFFASDVPAILKYTRKVIYLNNLEMAHISGDVAEVIDLNGDVVPRQATEITWDAEAAEKGGYAHFMLKEIHEQPTVVADTLHSCLKEDADEPGRYHLDLSFLELDEETIRSFRQIWIVACGSAWHVGMAAQYAIEDLAGIPVRVELASEFRYRRLLLDERDLVIIISQSGETADSLAALREAKERGIRTLAIVNVIGSSIAREAAHIFHTLAGPEIAVATTKAYSAQLVACYVLAIHLGLVRNTLDSQKAQELMKELNALSEKIERIIDDKERIQWFATKFSNASDAFLIGRGMDYAICLEGSLKMKEVSYIHSEAYAAGELKHGTISLIDQGTLVIGVATENALFEKTVSNMQEVKSRGAYLCGLTTYGNYSIEDIADFVIYVPRTDEHFTPSLAVIPLQLFGYYLALNRGLDVDKPRNLAKSVTVE